MDSPHNQENKKPACEYPDEPGAKVKQVYIIDDSVFLIKQLLKIYSTLN